MPVIADRSPATSRAISIGRRLFTPLALLCLLLAAYSAREVIDDVLREARLTPLILTVLIWALLNLVVPVISWIVLRGMGTAIKYRSTLDIHFNRLPARYLPGGIWQTVSRTLDLHAMGVNNSKLTVLVLVENLASLSIALLLGGIFILLTGSWTELSPAVIAAGGVLSIGLPWLLRRTVRQVRLSLVSYAGALAMMTLFWLVAATSFVTYLSAFPTLYADGYLLDLYGVYLLSWAAGFVAVFAPQGIGVFEYVASLLLQSSLPLAGTAVLVAGFRAAMLTGDMLAYLVGRLLRMTSGRRMNL